jgi:arylsulfatase A-like enzyme
MGSNRAIVIIVVLVLISLTSLVLYEHSKGQFVEYKCPDCNVIIIVVDAMRYDHIGYGGYARDTTPNLDILAQEGYFFTNTISAAPWTKPSVVSLFTSQYPHVHGVTSTKKALPKESLTLARILSSKNYTTIGFTTNVNVDNKNNDFSKLYSFNQDPADKFSNKTIFILNSTKQPFLIYLHYIDPHMEYNPPAAHRIFEDKNYTGFFTKKPNPNAKIENRKEIILKEFVKGSLSEKDKQFMIALYDGEIHFSDEQIGVLFDYLKKSGKWNKTMIIVTSDHGEELFDHNAIEHGHTLYDELIHIPLIIRIPGVGSRIIQSQVCSIDLAPTILDFLNISSPKSFQGDSLIPLISGDEVPEKPCFSESMNGIDGRSIRFNGWKLIENPNSTGGTGSIQKPKVTEMYYIVDDPSEKKNLFQDKIQVARSLTSTLDEWYHSNVTFRFNATNIYLSDDVIEQLKSLGYAV